VALWQQVTHERTERQRAEAVSCRRHLWHGGKGQLAMALIAGFLIGLAVTLGPTVLYVYLNKRLGKPVSSRYAFLQHPREQAGCVVMWIVLGAMIGGLLGTWIGFLFLDISFYGPMVGMLGGIPGGLIGGAVSTLMYLRTP
jgi:hypothetical protein